MRLLLLGGSAFLGRAVAAEALAAGHEVTVFNRGRTAPDVPGVQAVRGDRESQEDLARLADHGPWDAIVDTSGYVPQVVGDAVRALANSAQAYVFMSTINVFPDWPAQPVTDASPLHECSPDAGPDDGDYGTLKAGCERVVARDFPGRTLSLRLGLLLGPHEDVGRLPTLLLRMADAGTTRDLRTLAPGDPASPINPIDVRDIAAFTLSAIDQGLTGAYTVAGTPSNASTYGELLEACIDATASAAHLEWLDSAFLETQDIAFWSELPIWIPPGDVPWDADTSRAEAVGLRCRPLRETVQDTWAWLTADGGEARRTYEPRRPHGLSPEKERALLAAWETWKRSHP
ncbi:NAD-dependent epimerase/dehydratase [Catenulispora acidiphila DSM 44928]|uniref:NAD-dependent epimerase/dehydratase n=1 Tax=Catenulispora acidiphila (strain DSM 44928 / JCM 14897 / NBRC 102108 / NRRL B-24433 / ID139908) TaxID=479433 RepID=C7PVZ2_CATAD|nr:NAD-dependent epimerase/dehydratase family protein [Catenulispora acidiphila]ACU71384.1 NAD-dependent epimerase/dehydratase [Catenulispora acidiphila DSM 44928]